MAANVSQSEAERDTDHAISGKAADSNILHGPIGTSEKQEEPDQSKLEIQERSSNGNKSGKKQRDKIGELKKTERMGKSRASTSSNNQTPEKAGKSRSSNGNKQPKDTEIQKEWSEKAGKLEIGTQKNTSLKQSDQSKETEKVEEQSKQAKKRVRAQKKPKRLKKPKKQKDIVYQKLVESIPKHYTSSVKSILADALYFTEVDSIRFLDRTRRRSQKALPEPVVQKPKPVVQKPEPIAPKQRKKKTTIRKKTVRVKKEAGSSSIEPDGTWSSDVKEEISEDNNEDQPVFQNTVDDPVFLELFERIVTDSDKSLVPLARPIDSGLPSRYPKPILVQEFIELHMECYKQLYDDNLSVSLDNVLDKTLKESYLLLRPRDEELNPVYELGRTMKFIGEVYLPDEYTMEIINRRTPIRCVLGQFCHSVVNRDPEGTKLAVALFNYIVDKANVRSEIRPYLEAKKSIPRAFVHDIIDQIYLRTVSPIANSLRGYKLFSNNVYGEILPKLFSQMLDKVGAKSSDKFMDLGCGVGNCTLQAALELGCESYGVEMMPKALEACALQHAEYEKRCAYFGLRPGKVKFFLNQSFVDNKEVEQLVPDLDIVLVNNYIFSPDLNMQVGFLLKGLKPGSRVISLKNFVHPGIGNMERGLESVFPFLEVEEVKFGEDSVSWTNRGGVYYVSTVTTSPLKIAFDCNRGTRMRQKQT